jgi:carbon-monoxide dehydrogenase large subunit
MPRADNMPDIVSGTCPVPTKLNPLGVKGGSEPGNVGAPAAIINAIVDALSSYHVTDVPMPATPERIWRIIQRARLLAVFVVDTEETVLTTPYVK